MTAAKLFLPHVLRSPNDVAPYFRFGADYIVEVSRELGWGVGDLPETVDNAHDALKEGDTDVDDDVAELVGAVLVGDAEFFPALKPWLPRGYRLLMRGFEHPVRRKLLRVAGLYTDTLEPGFMEFYHAYPSVREGFGAPLFSRPADHPVNGKTPTSYVGGYGLGAYRRRVVLADCVLHVEWYSYAARRVGVDVPRDLVERTVEESVPYFAGIRDELSPDVQRFQQALFTDSEWIRDFHDTYGLRSVMLKQAVKGIEEARRDLRD